MFGCRVSNSQPLRTSKSGYLSQSYFFVNLEMAEEQDRSRDQSSGSSGESPPRPLLHPRPGRGKNLFGMSPPRPNPMSDDAEVEQYEEENEGEEGSSRGELVVSPVGTSHGPSEPKKKKQKKQKEKEKEVIVPRDGHEDDLTFPHSASVPPKLVVRCSAYADILYGELVAEEYRERYPRGP